MIYTRQASKKEEGLTTRRLLCVFSYKTDREIYHQFDLFCLKQFQFL